MAPSSVQKNATTSLRHVSYLPSWCGWQAGCQPTGVSARNQEINLPRQIQLAAALALLPARPYLGFQFPPWTSTEKVAASQTTTLLLSGLTLQEPSEQS